MKKMKSFAKNVWLTSSGASPQLDQTTLPSAGSSLLALELAVPFVICIRMQVIKRNKLNHLQKNMWLTSDAASPPLDPTTLRSAGTSPLVLEIVVKTGENTKGIRREVSRSGNSYV